MALVSTQPLTEMSTRNISWVVGVGGKGVRYVQLTTLTPSSAECLEIWELQLTGTVRASIRPTQILHCFCLVRLLPVKK
jgi:hypothetical protein